jgi:hypothetical protein
VKWRVPCIVYLNLHIISAEYSYLLSRCLPVLVVCTSSRSSIVRTANVYA